MSTSILPNPVQTLTDLGQKVQAKYPVYSDMDPAEVGRRVQSKFPGAYDDFVDAPPAASQMRSSALGKIGASMDQSQKTNLDIPATPGFGIPRTLAPSHPAAPTSFHAPAGPIESGIEDATVKGSRITIPGQQMSGVHNILKGAGEIGSVAAPAAIAAAPLATGLALGTGYLGGKVARKGAQAAGAGPDAQDVAEDVGNLAGGYGGSRLPELGPAAKSTFPGLQNPKLMKSVAEELPYGIGKMMKFWNAAREVPQTPGPFDNFKAPPPMPPPSRFAPSVQPEPPKQPITPIPPVRFNPKPSEPVAQNPPPAPDARTLHYPSRMTSGLEKPAPSMVAKPPVAEQAAAPASRIPTPPPITAEPPSGLNPATQAQSSPPVVGTPVERLYKAVDDLEPVKGVPVSTLRLRAALPDLSKEEFDKAALQLRNEQRVFASEHADPFNITDEERNVLIHDPTVIPPVGNDYMSARPHGTHYVAFGVREKPAASANTSIEETPVPNPPQKLGPDNSPVYKQREAYGETKPTSTEQVNNRQGLASQTANALMKEGFKPEDMDSLKYQAAKDRLARTFSKQTKYKGPSPDTSSMIDSMFTTLHQKK